MEDENSDKLLEKIQKINKSKVLSLIYPREAAIEQPDVDRLYDVLRKLGPSDRMDIILFSYGGDADAAYKIIKVVRNFCKKLFIIIPSEAKSAATLMCFGSDKIYMGPVSEMGPVDPMVRHPMIPVWVPARACLRFIEDYVSILSKVPGVEKLPIVPVDPIHVGFCRLAIDSAKEYGEILLKEYNLKGKNSRLVKKVLNKISGGYSSHSFVIDYDEASKLGLNVEKMSDELLDSVWKLYRLYQAELETIKRREEVQVIVETEKGRSNIVKTTPRRLLF